MTKVINLWAGPGAGKSTCAAGLFFLMKTQGLKCELVSEYAKDKVYEEAWGTLDDQWYVTGHQARRLRRLVGQVDWIITDSPIPVGLLYLRKPYDELWFREAMWGLFDTFENYNCFIERKKVYQNYGRSQTEAEARILDDELSKLAAERIDLHVPGDLHAPQVIYERLFGPLKH